MTFPFGVPVTLLKRVKTGTDAFNNDVFNDVPQGTVTGAFAPGGSVEQIQGRDMVITQPTVYLPAGTDLGAVDAVEIGALQYEVDGDPHNWVNPWTGWRAGLEVRLRRVTG